MSEQRVRLRAVTEADLPDYVRWLNDPEVTEFTALESGGASLGGEREWFALISDPESRARTWAIEADGRHIGNCALHLDASGQTAGFGIIIGDKTQWGKGFGTAALRQVLRIAFREMGLYRVHLQAFAANARGVRCYEKCGFRHEGLHRRARLKRGEWRDIVSMAILREEWHPEEAASEAGPRLRTYRTGDYDQVFALWQAVGFSPDRRDSREALECKLRDDRGPFLVAEADGRVVGTALGSWDGRRAWVYRVAVDPPYQGKGLGRRLVIEVEGRLRELGARTAALLVSTENERTLRFYRKLGYEVEDHVGFMRKLLDPTEER